MNKKIIISASVVLLPLGTVVGQPNVILILADDLGIGDVSAFNPESKIRTTHIDELCRNGIRFTDAHSTSALSTPSRYSLLTGRYAFRTTLKRGTLQGFHGVVPGYSDPLIGSNRTTMAKVFKSAGYDTACIGKWHLGWFWGMDENGNVDYSKPITEGPLTRGFDYFYGIAGSLDMSPYVYVENDMPTALPDSMFGGKKGILLQREGPVASDFDTEDVLPGLGRRSVEYIRKHAEVDRPFFLYLPLTAPHTPILPTEEYRGKSGLTPYGDFVLMVDDIVGGIVAELKRTGQYDNTIIVFASDNGCAPYAGVAEMREKGHRPSYIYRGMKSDLFDGGHRVPLVVSWDGRFAPDTEDRIVSLADLFSTFADMIGYRLDDNEGEDSYSLWPLLCGKGKFARKDVVNHSGEGYFALRSGKWKLLFCPGSGGWAHPTMRDPCISELPKIQLYDMETDPGEKTNLYDKYPKVVAKLTAKMCKYLEEGRSTPGKPQNNDEVKGEWKQISAFIGQGAR